MSSPSDSEFNDQLVIALRRASEALFDRRTMRDRDAMLDQLVAAAVDAVPGATGGGITRTEAGGVRSTHATDPTISKLDQFQSELNEGPCITAADDPPPSGVVIVEDLAGLEADRWPRFAPIAAETGFRSMVSTHLTTRPGGPRSALNLYSPEPGTFDEPARHTAGLFALQVAALLYGADEADGLQHALETRDVIGRAKGILMERLTIGDAEAFQTLVNASQDTNIKLSDVATWLANEAEQRQHSAHRPDPASSES